MHPYKAQADKTHKAKTERFADGGPVKNQRRYGGNEDVSEEVYKSDVGPNAMEAYAKRLDFTPPPDATGSEFKKGLQTEAPKFTKD
jgi:hypothetical protein